MKVLIAMSGGVDSAVCAYLIKQSGYDALGVTMRLNGDGDITRFTEAEQDAARVAEALGIPFSVADLREPFSRLVVDRFVAEYEAGRTPNPCVDCNRHLKFGALLAEADRLGCDFIATGHYARLTREEDGLHLRKAADESKDQSYMLSCLTESVLSRVLLPLGDLTKTQVRELAFSLGFSNAGKKDSQDICFIPDGDHGAFLTSRRGQEYPPGDFIGPDGKVLGRHRGLIRYTVGQRKGLGLSLPSPLFVRELDAEHNAVLLGDAASLLRDELTLTEVTYLAPARLSLSPDVSFSCSARVRYHQKETPALAFPQPDGRLTLRFLSPVRAPAPGQTAVLYRGDEVLASG